VDIWSAALMNQLPAIDRPRSCPRLRSVSPPVVSDASTNGRLGSCGSDPVSSKTPSALLLKNGFDIMAIVLCLSVYHFLFTRLRWHCSSRLEGRQVLSGFLRHSALLYGLGISVFI